MNRLRDGDLAHLVRALAIAEHAQWRTSPNPTVGCVIAHGDTIIAEGVSLPAGGAHAEQVALKLAGDRAHGASVFVTLAPCGHHGRTPPCVDALIGAGVARVVIGIDDPHVVAAGGVERLQAANVPVTMLDTRHPVAEAIRAQLAGFLTVVTSKRPYVTLKIAQTLGGSMQATNDRWITSAKARRAVHRLRDQSDAVLVGSGTVLADNPVLTVRDVERAIAEQPHAVVFDRRLRTPPSAAVARPGTLIMTVLGHQPSKLTALRATGATVIEVAPGANGERTSRTEDEAAELRRVVTALGEYGINRVLAEPGPTLAQAMLKARVVDRIVVHIADDGTGSYRPALNLQGLSTTMLRLGGVGPDVIVDQELHQHDNNSE